MGLAFAELHWSPNTFWHSTVRELMTAYAYIVPEDVNTAKGFKPFTEEEREILDQMKAKVEREERLKQG